MYINPKGVNIRAQKKGLPPFLIFFSGARHIIATPTGSHLSQSSNSYLSTNLFYLI